MCGVSEHDLKTLVMKRPRSSSAVEPWGGYQIHVQGEGLCDLTGTRLKSRFYLLRGICGTTMIANCLIERSSARYLINLQHLRTSLP